MKKLLLVAIGVLSTSITACADQGSDLILAAKKGNVERARELINAGVPVDFEGESGRTALMEAIIAGSSPVVEFLVSRGADVNHIQKKTGRTALIYAVISEDLENAEEEPNEIAKLLLEKASGINLDHQTINGTTALIGAASRGNVELVNLLLEKGASPWIQRKDGKTALALAKKNYLKALRGTLGLIQENYLEVLRGKQNTALPSTDIEDAQKLLNDLEEVIKILSDRMHLKMDL